MKRCPECGRGGGKGTRLSSPELLTLAANELAAGTDIEGETIEQLVLLRKYLRAAEKLVDARIEQLASEKANTPYLETKISQLQEQVRLLNGIQQSTPRRRS